MSAHGMSGASFQMTTILTLCSRMEFVERIRHPQRGFDPQGAIVTTPLLDGPLKVEIANASIGEIINILLSAYRCVERSQQAQFSRAFAAIARALILEPVSDMLALYLVGQCGMLLEGERIPDKKRFRPRPDVGAVDLTDLCEAEDVESPPDSQASVPTAMRPPPLPTKTSAASSA